MPDWSREVRRRVSSLPLSPTRETEIVEELSQHLDDRWRELIAGGASPEEAAVGARRLQGRGRPGALPRRVIPAFHAMRVNPIAALRYE